MARKGSRKVRTGCLTCKIRKIKCDEGKPFCNRCTSTGRKCDGYAVEPASVLRWQRPQTLQIDSSTNGEEARALQYYCEHVAPFIAGPTDPYFWTHLVVQFVNREPAVKHSVIAIGLLYGNMNGGTNTHLDGVALSHYNAAIFELKSLQDDNNGIALVVCLLFVSNEAGFDQHLERFRQITEQTTKFAESQVNCQPTHFLFEAGYTPSLFFIATKCRALDVRLEALRLLSTLGSPREAVWDKGELFCIARRLIELEHNVGLDSFGVLQYTGPESCLGLPRDEVRIRHFVPEKSTLWDSSINGMDMGGNFKVRFFMRTPEDALYVHEEVLGCEYVPDLSPFEGQHESFSSSPQSTQGWEEISIF
ncbi:Aspercryptin biosynthesis cluster-specific transcription regulator atnN [Colletotrichum siamense]|uniref:Aspercryptin biosynthesis cluster-specific transcription regulator atnN n=1 Tax=Colletotrichum siamense TaxID=690259 RepID=A0A9P5K427_COLSI|nr:Aspercryptin biosynthesis cluster-specific transcription regulator atnN [Colletotrichum siamense]KAF4857851.1 Aspercryptin biosynthesis cluster-specific transcription regulator atnN [Colletotrichum siamense]